MGSSGVGGAVKRERTQRRDTPYSRGKAKRNASIGYVAARVREFFCLCRLRVCHYEQVPVCI